MLTHIFFLVLTIAVFECNANCNVLDLTQCHTDYLSAVQGIQNQSHEEMKKTQCSAINSLFKCLNKNAECKEDATFKAYLQITQSREVKDTCGGADSAFKFSLWISVLMAGVTMAFFF